MPIKVKRTIRLKKELDKKIVLKAGEIGVSTNAFISMILAKEMNQNCQNTKL